MMAMRIAGGVTFTIVVVAALFAAVVLISGGFRRSYSDREADFKKLPMVQLVGAARIRGDESRAVISSETSSRFKRNNPRVSSVYGGFFKCERRIHFFFFFFFMACYQLLA